MHKEISQFPQKIVVLYVGIGSGGGGGTTKSLLQTTLSHV